MTKQKEKMVKGKGFVVDAQVIKAMTRLWIFLGDTPKQAKQRTKKSLEFVEKAVPILERYKVPEEDRLRIFLVSRVLARHHEEVEKEYKELQEALKSRPLIDARSHISATILYRLARSAEIRKDYFIPAALAQFRSIAEATKSWVGFSNKEAAREIIDHVLALNREALAGGGMTQEEWTKQVENVLKKTIPDEHWFSMMLYGLFVPRAMVIASYEKREKARPLLKPFIVPKRAKKKKVAHRK